MAEERPALRGLLKSTRESEVADNEARGAREASATPNRLFAFRRNSAFIALFAICVVAGAVVGVIYLPDDFSFLRRLLGGAIGGGGIAFLMTATKML